MIKVTIVFVMLYLGFAGLLYIGQRGMIYFPSTAMPSASDINARGLRYWPALEDYRGVTPLQKTPAHAVIVHFHGNASLARDRPELAMSLAAAGFHVIMAEYPGYGGRAGKPTEAALIEDAVATVRLIKKETGLPVYLWGESLGSGVAAGVISALNATGDGATVKAVVLQVPFDSMANVAQHHYWYLPARWLLKDKFNSVEYLRDYRGRVAVLVAEDDQVIPVQFGVNLFDSISTDKKLWVVKGAQHYMPADRTTDWWQEVLEFIEGKCGRAGQRC